MTDDAYASVSVLYYINDIIAYTMLYICCPRIIAQRRQSESHLLLQYDIMWHGHKGDSMYSEVTSVAGGMFVRSESQAENSSVNQSQWEQKYNNQKWTSEPKEQQSETETLQP